MTTPYGPKKPALPRANRGKVFKRDFNPNLSVVTRFLAFGQMPLPRQIWPNQSDAAITKKALSKPINDKLFASTL